ncbi:MAG: hypothetical protein AAGI90_06625 [Chlamydiota bacterium]
MLSFFRKYQKSLLVFITILIIFSFVFSGVYSTLGAQRKSTAVYVTKTWKKQPVEERDLKKWVVFLSREKDGESLDQMNLFNVGEGILVEDFFHTGVFEQLFQEKKAQYQKHYEAIWDKITSYHFYEHPHAAQLSAKVLWGSFAPDILAHLSALPKTFDEKAFTLLLRLYEAERKFPPTMLKKALRYYEEQTSAPKDVHLSARNLSLFGFKSALDWFPQELLEDAALFLMSAGEYAKEEGISFGPVSMKQVIYNALADLPHEEGDLPKLAKRQMQALGLHQKDLFAIISSVRRLRNYRESVGKSAWLSPIFLQKVSKEGLRRLHVEEHRMAPQFDWQTPLDYAYFALYKMAISPSTGKEILAYFSPEVLKKDRPDFVYKDFELEVSYISVEEVSAHIPLQEIWSWQTEDGPYRAILRQFPEIGGVTALTKEVRRECLQRCPRSLQRKITDFSKREMIQDFPHLITTQLKKKPSLPVSAKLFASGTLTGFSGMDTKKLSALLEEAPCKGQIDLTEEELQVKEELLLLPNGQEGFFQVEIVSKGEQDNILTYLDAKNLGVLAKLFQEHKEEMEPVLQEMYPEIVQKQNSLQEADQAVAKALFPCQDMEGYFYALVEKERSEVSRKEYANTIAEQFFLQSSKKTLTENSATLPLFSLKPGETSLVNQEGLPHFYTMVHLEEIDPSQSEEYLQLQKTLSQEAEKKMSKVLCERFMQEQVFLR